jgi:hypothetical protein
VRVVISQSMLFPWRGMLEQVRLADVFVHYDDVQFSKGSFTNRVQVKTAAGMRWMTVPTPGLHLGQCIDAVALADHDTWVPRHLALLRQSFDRAPHASDALALAQEVYAARDATLDRLARRSLMALVDYFGLASGRSFVDVKDLAVAGSGSERVLQVVQRLGGNTYVTGHGAARYLDHEAFARAGVEVEYIDYRLTPYPQLHGDFVPYVTALDLVANCGTAGAACIASPSVHWKAFLDESAERI